MVPLPEPAPHPLLLLRGLAARALDGYQAAAPLLKEALRQYRDQPQKWMPCATPITPWPANCGTTARGSSWPMAMSSSRGPAAP